MPFIKLVKRTLKNLTSPPATRLYPQIRRPAFKRTRGHIAWDDSCIFCSICVRRCPTGALAVDRAAKTWRINRFDCVQCGACVEVCPKHSLAMRNDYTPPAAEKTVDEEAPHA